MLTAYKEDLKYQLDHAKKEMKLLLEERESRLHSKVENPFKGRNARDLNQVIVECAKEIRILKKKIANENF